MVSLTQKDIVTFGMTGSIALTIAGCASVFVFRGPVPQERSHLAYRWLFASTSVLLSLSWVSEPFMRLQRVVPAFILAIWERWLLASIVLIPVFPIIEIISMRRSRSKENDKALVVDCVLAGMYLALICFVLIVALPGMAV
jgi:hypothetical protein